MALVYKLVGTNGSVHLTDVEAETTEEEANTNLETKMASASFTLGGKIYVLQNLLYGEVCDESEA